MDTKLEQLTEAGNFRAKVGAIVRNGRALGYELVIHGALRSQAEQRLLVQQGLSKTMRSMHLPGLDGLARAADIVDSRYGWDAPRAVWIVIGRLALTQNCDWGGLWGLPRSLRQRLHRFLNDRERVFNPLEWEGKIGWDPAHVQRRK